MLRVEGSDASIHFTSVNEATTQRKEKKGRTCHHDLAKVKFSLIFFLIKIV